MPYKDVEKRREKVRRWKLEHPEEVKAQKRRHRERKRQKQHNPSISDDELTRLLQAPRTQPSDVDQVVQDVLFGRPA